MLLATLATGDGLPTVPRPDPFTAYAFVDTLRLVLAFGGILFAMLCAKVAYYRFRNVPPDLTLCLAWSSHAIFALSTTGFALVRLGQPPSWGFLAALALGLLTGTAAMLRTLKWPRWYFRRHRIKV